MRKDTLKKLFPKKPTNYQMTLGSLIKALSKERSSVPIKILFPNTSTKFNDQDTIWSIPNNPGKPHSYYGYHSDLAFEPTEKEITVAEFIEICKDCLDKSFVAPDDSQSEFYRDHIMKANTPIWVSKLDNANNFGIVDVLSENDGIFLKTEEIKEEEEK